MNLNLQFKINDNEMMRKYLLENSNWYKHLNRSDEYFNEFIENMKTDYKLRAEDKMTNFVNKLETVSTLIDLLK